MRLKKEKFIINNILLIIDKYIYIDLLSFIRFSIGDDKEHFCLQSVSKCLHYPIVLEDLTAEVVSRKFDLHQLSSF